MSRMMREAAERTSRLSASRFLFNSISLQREIRSTALGSSQKWSQTRSKEKNDLCELVLMNLMALYTPTRQTWVSQSCTQQVEHVNHIERESIPKIVHVGRRDLRSFKVKIFKKSCFLLCRRAVSLTCVKVYLGSISKHVHGWLSNKLWILTVLLRFEYEIRWKNYVEAISKGTLCLISIYCLPEVQSMWTCASNNLQIRERNKH